jgi:hypothetical protein
MPFTVTRSAEPLGDRLSSPCRRQSQAAPIVVFG